MNHFLVTSLKLPVQCLCCAGPSVQLDSGEQHAPWLDHVQSQYWWSSQPGPSGWNNTNKRSSDCCSLPSSLLCRKLHHSWWHPRPSPGHLHQAAAVEKGMSPTHLSFKFSQIDLIWVNGWKTRYLHPTSWTQEICIWSFSLLSGIFQNYHLQNMINK